MAHNVSLASQAEPAEISREDLAALLGKSIGSIASAVCRGSFPEGHPVKTPNGIRSFHTLASLREFYESKGPGKLAEFEGKLAAWLAVRAARGE